MNKFIVLLIALLSLPIYSTETWKTVQIMKSPARRVCGLAYDGRYLWHGESNGPGILYKTELKTGRRIKQISTKMYDPGDIEWLNGFIWVTEENKIPFADGTSKYCVKKINPATGVTVDSIAVDVP
ncbi:MAG: hypothetical protein JNL74_10330, partial [Fibrobacteres bacterium]|nr:hypothetical protein [Fibrobacterota bacterium]